jgi:hypothetical protein
VLVNRVNSLPSSFNNGAPRSNFRKRRLCLVKCCLQSITRSANCGPNPSKRTGVFNRRTESLRQKQNKIKWNLWSWPTLHVGHLRQLAALVWNRQNHINLCVANCLYLDHPSNLSTLCISYYTCQPVYFDHRWLSYGWDEVHGKQL